MPSFPALLQIEMEPHPSPGIHRKIDHQRHRLADVRGNGGTVDAHGRASEIAEDQDGIQNDIGDAPRHHAVHGHLHPAGGLKQLLIHQLNGHDDGGGEDDQRISSAVIEDLLVVGIQTKERRNDGKADPGEKNAVEDAQQDPQRPRLGSFLLLLCSQIEGHRRIDADAEADAHRADDILYGKHQGEGRHGILADLRHKIAVYDVVQGVDQHGQHHGQ